MAGTSHYFMVQEFVPGTEYAVNVFLNQTATVVVVLEKQSCARGVTAVPPVCGR